MINTVIATNYLGDSIALELARPELSGLVVQSITGLGPADATINVTDISTNDGGMFNSSRLDKRNIVMKLCPLANPSVEANRLKTYQFFPIKKPVTLTFETENRRASIVGYVEKNEPDIFSKRETISISLICPDPYFYSADKDGDHITSFGGIEPAFEFPFPDDERFESEPLVEFGTIEILTEKNVYYGGDAEIGVVINIHALGAVGDITIYNTGTREQMIIENEKIKKLTGSGIGAKDDIIITTIKGKKSIYLLRAGVKTNILNCLRKDSTWFQLAKGDNLFTFNATFGGTLLQFKVTNKIIYEGI